MFGGAKGVGSVLDGVRVVDAGTVQLALTQPVGFLPSMLAAPYVQISSPTAIRTPGQAYGTPGVGIVGTGPTPSCSSGSSP